MAKKYTKYTPKPKKRGVSICSGCIEEFKYTELYNVRILDQIGMNFITTFCADCVEKKKFPQHEKLEVLGKVTEPRTKKKK